MAYLCDSFSVHVHLDEEDAKYCATLYAEFEAAKAACVAFEKTMAELDVPLCNYNSASDKLDDVLVFCKRRYSRFLNQAIRDVHIDSYDWS